MLLIKKIAISIKNILITPIFWLVFSLLIFTLILLIKAPESNVRAYSELLRGASTLAWPALVILGGWYFRREVRSLIGRTRKVGPTGAEFAEEAIASQRAAKPFRELLQEMDPHANPSDSVSETIELIRDDIYKQEPADSHRRETILVWRLANNFLIASALRVYIGIFQSQYEALEAMIASGAETDLITFHSAHIERYNSSISAKEGETHFSFERWARFLTTNNLATIVGREGTITSRGRDFIAFIEREGLATPAVL